MSSFAYLLASDRFDSDLEAMQDDAEQLADACHCLPLLWMALLAADGPKHVDDEHTVFATDRLAGIERLQRRSGRLASLLPKAHVPGYVARLSEMMAEESAELLIIDATDIAYMDEPEVLVGDVAQTLAWLDGDDAAAGPAAIRRQCGLHADSELPEPVDGLDGSTTLRQWQRVIAMLGSGDAWW
ncbi:MAG TPA: hypothetical protein ENK57_09465 [Polyangiaceae bacterium]|nr:hypothetical protein [Polyangiaceae bacterium]